jgi:hypothetical protein
MAEIRTVTTLRRKRDEVRKAVRKYERCLDQARADLTHLIAAIAIFEAKNGDESLPAYADLPRSSQASEPCRRPFRLPCLSSGKCWRGTGTWQREKGGNVGPYGYLSFMKAIIYDR